MKALFLLIAAMCCSTVAAVEPSDASIRELMALSEVRKPLDALLAETERTIEIGMRQKFLGFDMTVDRQVIVDNGIKRMRDVLRSEMRWEKHEAARIAVYRRAFSQAEVDAMIAFYRTPAGKAMVERMPAVKQEDLQISLDGFAAVFTQFEEIDRDILMSLRLSQVP